MLPREYLICHALSRCIKFNINIIVLKCTGIQTDEVEDASETEIRNADLNTANSALFANPKVVDNFFATYITLMSENKNRK